MHVFVLALLFATQPLNKIEEQYDLVEVVDVYNRSGEIQGEKLVFYNWDVPRRSFQERFSIYFWSMGVWDSKCHLQRRWRDDRYVAQWISSKGIHKFSAKQKTKGYEVLNYW